MTIGDFALVGISYWRMQLLVLLVAVLLAGLGGKYHTVAASPSDCFQYNVVFEESFFYYEKIHDYYSTEVHRWFTTYKVIDHLASASACQAECASDDLCLFFSYLEPDADPRAGPFYGLAPGACMLKRPRAERAVGITSGTRYGIDCDSYNLKMIGEVVKEKPDIVSAEECQSLCVDESNCLFFSYNLNTNTCILMYPNTHQFNGAKSGPKSCS